MKTRTKPWGQVKVEEKRIEFVLRARRGLETMTALCQQFEISRTTGYKWLRRFEQCSSVGELGELSRRPHRSPNQTAPEIEQRVLEQRRKRPDWGAPKLREMLAQEGVELPWITVHRILKRNGMIGEPVSKPALKRFERKQPNELWQVDFKGMPAIVKNWLPLTAIDDHSRYVVGLWGLAGTTGKGVRASLEGLFQQTGLPQAILFDHGVPWWSTTSRIGLTKVSVWLLKLGVRLYFSGFRHPQTQGKVERFHGSLERAMQLRGYPHQPVERAQWLEQFRREYNEVRPHEALDMRPPATRWRQSERPYPDKPVEWEYPAGVCLERLNAQGMLKWSGKRWFICEALANELVRVEELDHRLLVWFRSTLICEVNRRAVETSLLVSTPPSGDVRRAASPACQENK